MKIWLWTVVNLNEWVVYSNDIVIEYKSCWHEVCQEGVHWILFCIRTVFNFQKHINNTIIIKHSTYSVCDIRFDAARPRVVFIKVTPEDEEEDIDLFGELMLALSLPQLLLSSLHLDSTLLARHISTGISDSLWRRASRISYVPALLRRFVPVAGPCGQQETAPVAGPSREQQPQREVTTAALGRGRRRGRGCGWGRWVHQPSSSPTHVPTPRKLGGGRSGRDAWPGYCYWSVVFM